MNTGMSGSGDAQRLRLLMTELGPQAPHIDAIVERQGGSAWAIAMDDEALVEAEFDAAHQRLSLWHDLPAPPAEARMEVLETLLSFNLLDQGEHPLRMAMDRSDSSVVLLCDVSTADLSLHQLQAALGILVHEGARWRAAITSAFAKGRGTDLTFAEASLGFVRG